MCNGRVFACFLNFIKAIIGGNILKAICIPLGAAQKVNALHVILKRQCINVIFQHDVQIILIHRTEHAPLLGKGNNFFNAVLCFPLFRIKQNNAGIVIIGAFFHSDVQLIFVGDDGVCHHADRPALHVYCAQARQ